MGLDMCLYIRNKNGENLTDNLVDFRNSQYFGEVMGDGFGDRVEYDIFHDMLKFDETLFAQELKEEEEERAKGYTTGNFGFGAISVKDFREWYDKYEPYKRAGYLPRYKSWLCTVKNIKPYEDVIRYSASKEMIEEEDLVFTEFIKEDFMAKVMDKTSELRTKFLEDNAIRYNSTEALRTFDNNTYICLYFNR